MSSSMHLFGFWRSLASYRVRIALALKGIGHSEESVNLLEGEQFQGEVLRLNPQSVIPILLHDDAVLTQSLAILEYLEECYPNPPLLPESAIDRVKVRAFSLITIADTHPLTVPRTRKQLATQFNASDDDITLWAQHWSTLGLQAMEARLAERQRKTDFCFSDDPGLADIALASQAAGAGFFGISLDTYPCIAKTMAVINLREEFVTTSPQTLAAKLHK